MLLAWLLPAILVVTTSFVAPTDDLACRSRLPGAVGCDLTSRGSSNEPVVPPVPPPGCLPGAGEDDGPCWTNTCHPYIDSDRGSPLGLYWTGNTTDAPTEPTLSTQFVSIESDPTYPCSPVDPGLDTFPSPVGGTSAPPSTPTKSRPGTASDPSTSPPQPPNQ